MRKYFLYNKALYSRSWKMWMEYQRCAHVHLCAGITFFFCQILRWIQYFKNLCTSHTSGRHVVKAPRVQQGFLTYISREMAACIIYKEEGRDNLLYQKSICYWMILLRLMRPLKFQRNFQEVILRSVLILETK